MCNFLYYCTRIYTWNEDQGQCSKSEMLACVLDRSALFTYGRITVLKWNSLQAARGGPLVHGALQHLDDCPFIIEIDTRLLKKVQLKTHIWLHAYL
jgi:hypothetical protein